MFFGVIPECVARVPVSLWGSGGWGCVRSTLRLCSQPFATVRNRPQPFMWWPYGLAYGKFCRRGHFWRFHMWRYFVSRGRRGTSWHSDVFCREGQNGRINKRQRFHPWVDRGGWWLFKCGVPFWLKVTPNLVALNRWGYVRVDSEQPCFR